MVTIHGASLASDDLFPVSDRFPLLERITLQRIPFYLTPLQSERTWPVARLQPTFQTLWGLGFEVRLAANTGNSSVLAIHDPETQDLFPVWLAVAMADLPVRFPG
jgi:hypothetical protein